jgi:hypothetical protein
MFKGSFVALITPFLNGQIDEQAFRKFVAWQVREGTNGLVPCGTTGESPTLSHEEHEAVIPVGVEPAEEPSLHDREIDDAADGVHVGAAGGCRHLDVHPVVVPVQTGALALVPQEPVARAEAQPPHDGEARR